MLLLHHTTLRCAWAAAVDVAVVDTFAVDAVAVTLTAAGHAKEGDEWG